MAEKLLNWQQSLTHFLDLYEYFISLLYLNFYKSFPISFLILTLGRHVADSLRHIIPILSQPVFLLNAAYFIAEKQQTPL
jgi:hypothetical protein